MKRPSFGRRLLALVLPLAALAGRPALPCSVLSHEAIIDAAWSTKLEPLLRARFPQASADEIKNAHGYAYGGAIIQDLGYYPHGNKFFSDLTHYVRTGDFVLALIGEAQNLNELAFALGALSHYSSDSDVHRFATNPGEAMLYPKLERRFGHIVTYEDEPATHLKTEFGFDVLEVAKGNFAPEAYHSFIGFGVAPQLLDRAFQRTYSLRLADLFPDLDRSLNSYRRAVSRTIPQATRVAWAQREHDIEKSRPGVTRAKFVYIMSQSSYEREWGVQYDRPTLKDRIAARLLKLLPPIGPLKTLQFKMPTPEVEKLFTKSFDRAADEYNKQIDRVRANTLALADVNYDLGEVAKPGAYALQDQTYGLWINELAESNFQAVNPDVRQTLLTYFQAISPNQSGKDQLTQARVAAALKQLRDSIADSSSQVGTR